MRTLSVGKANVSVINVGDFMWDLTEKMHIPESAWRPRYAACFERPQLFPTQAIHIVLPGASILVDPCYHDLAPGFLSLMPDYQQPPRLMAQLAEKEVQPEDITHVVITHAHFDHYADVTREQEGHVLPSFPHAHCFLGRADWEDRSVQEALQDPSSNESRTLGVLHQYRLLELVEGNRDLVPGVRMIATPGETPGHYIVRVHSEGQTLYCLGDLYHHEVEFEQPTWMVHWIDQERNLKSRSALMEAALAEHALLLAAHIPIGYLKQAGSEIKWMALERELHE